MQYITSDFVRTHFTAKPAASDIVYLLITDSTIIEADEVDGIQWPWPRQAYGEAIKFLKNAGAKAIVFDVIFSETSREGFEDDTAFADSIKSGNIFLSYLSTNHRGNASMEKVSKNDRIMSKHAVPVIVSDPVPFISEYKYFRPPAEALFNATDNLGDVKFLSDSDGIGRRYGLLYKAGSKYYPSLSFSVAANILGIQKTIVSREELIMRGEGIERKIPLDDKGLAWLKYYGNSSVYEKYLLLRVIKSQIKIEEGGAPYYDPSDFKDKIVIIASDSTELKDLRPNPFNKFNDTGAHYHGTAIDNIIREDFIKPNFQPGLVVPTIIILALITGILTANCSAFTGFICALFLVLTNSALGILLYLNFNMLTELSATNISIAGSFMLAGLVNYFLEARQRAFIVNAFGQYLSPRVIKDLVEDPTKLKLGGEKRRMTAFFSDVVGFSTISEKLSPEELVALLNEYLSEMCDIIGKYEGAVDKFEGDAIIAFWGAPIPNEEHALLACKASLEMNNRMIELRDKFKKEGKAELYVRMGLNSGPMVVGNMGSSQRMNYTIMGDSVNLASRLEGANKFYDTYLMISEYTYEDIKEEIETRKLDFIKVIGKNDPVLVYELLALKGDLPLNKKKGYQLFEQALDIYRQQKFEEAIQDFKRVLEFIPNDPPSKIFLKRCSRFLENRPAPDWDGVHQLASKG